MIEGNDSFAIEFQVDVDDHRALPLERMRQAMIWVLAAEQVTRASITVVFATDDFVQRLNREFRGIDRPTDVLSFPIDPSDSEVLPEMAGYLGDLVLALPYITRQSEQAGHSLEDELMLAVVHGTLHLLGYDHDTAAHQREMWTRQAQALDAMDVSIVVPLYTFDDDDPDSVDSPLDC